MGVNFGNMNPHQLVQHVDKYNRNLHNQDFCIRTEKPYLPPVNRKRIERMGTDTYANQRH